MMTVILADADEQFVARFLSYERESEQPLQFAAYTNLTSFKRYLQSIGQRDEDERAMIVICEKWVEALSKEMVRMGKQGQIVVVLSERQQVDGTWPTIFKYQRLDQFIAQLMKRNAEENVDVAAATMIGKQKIIAFISAVGGSGKTVAAINMVKRAAQLGRSVFYLNLEALSCVDIHMPAREEDDMAQLLYYLKMKEEEQFTAKLLSIIKRNKELGCDFINGIVQYRDCDDMSADDVKRVVRTLQSEKGYDAIIIDLDASLHPKNLGALAVCDDIIWLVTDDRHCLAKTKKMIAQLPAVDGENGTPLWPNIHFTLNKYTGHVVNDFASEGLDIAFHLPYIPTWKAIGDVAVLSNNHKFTAHVNALFDKLHVGGKERQIV